MKDTLKAGVKYEHKFLVPTSKTVSPAPARRID